MLKLNDISETERWTHESDDDFWAELRPFGGPITSHDQAEIYMRRCIVAAGGFEHKGKGIKEWIARTGMATYMNGKRSYVGTIPWHFILPPVLATELLAHLYEISRLPEDEAKNS